MPQHHQLHQQAVDEVTVTQAEVEDPVDEEETQEEEEEEAEEAEVKEMTVHQEVPNIKGKLLN